MTDIEKVARERENRLRNALAALRKIGEAGE